MTERECQRLAGEWVLLSEYFRQKLDLTVVKLYVQDLADLPIDGVLTAMRQLRLEPKRRNCPLPGDVRARVQTQGHTSAEELSARIAGSISRFGYTRPDAARAHIGEIGWGIVVTLGGWQQLCNTLRTDEMGTFRAQVREMCRGALERCNDQLAPQLTLSSHHDLRSLPP